MAQTSRDVLGYPRQMAAAVMNDAEMRLRLLRNCGGGVKFASVCTGIDAAGEALRLIQSALQESGDLSSSWVVPSSFCDVGKPQQQFLEQLLQKRFPHNFCPCLFAALEERVPQHVQEKCRMTKAIMTQVLSQSPGKQVAKSFYEDMARNLREHSAEAFPQNATSYCRTHDDMCRVRQTRAMPTCGSEQPGESLSLGSATEHGQVPPDKLADDALTVGLGGLPCVAWSKVGLKKGASDPTERTFVVWVQERRQLCMEGAEDMFIFENVQDFPAEAKIQAELDSTHHIVILKFDPQDSGSPGDGVPARVTLLQSTEFC